MSTQISVFLNNKSLWLQQEDVMEMISRKPTPLFPILEFEVQGLDSDVFYDVTLTLERKGSTRMAFDKSLGKWTESTKRSTKENHEYKAVKIPGGPKSGKELLKEGMNFGKVKISSRLQDEEMENVIYVDTMQLYIPVVTISTSDSPIIRLEIDAAQFIPVTVYQNPSIGTWKGSLNKFATFKNRGGGGGSSGEIGKPPKRGEDKEAEPKLDEKRGQDPGPNSWVPMHTVAPQWEEYQQYYTNYSMPTLPTCHQDFEGSQGFTYFQGYQDFGYQYLPMPMNYCPPTPAATVPYYSTPIDTVTPVMPQGYYPGCQYTPNVLIPSTQIPYWYPPHFQNINYQF